MVVAFFVFLTMRFPAAPPSSPLLFFPFSLSRTGGPTGARDRFTRRDKCHRVRLGFPLCCSSAEGVMIKLHLESSLNVPEHPTSPSPPSLPLNGRKTEMKFFNCEPITVNKKNMHYSRSHWIIASNTKLPPSPHPTRPIPPPPPSTLNWILRSAHTHYLFLSLFLPHTRTVFPFVSQNALQISLTWYLASLFFPLLPLGWC